MTMAPCYQEPRLPSFCRATCSPGFHPPGYLMAQGGFWASSHLVHISFEGDFWKSHRTDLCSTPSRNVVCSLGTLPPQIKLDSVIKEKEENGWSEQLAICTLLIAQAMPLDLGL